MSFVLAFVALAGIGCLHVVALGYTVRCNDESFVAEPNLFAIVLFISNALCFCCLQHNAIDFAFRIVC